jgi:hypothetical protein
MQRIGQHIENMNLWFSVKPYGACDRSRAQKLIIS